MTQTRRLFLNVFASHGRALFTLICGLLTGRWALMVLGQVDYGLLGLIGGLIVFISLINNVLACSVSRFFAYSIGEAKTEKTLGLEMCQRWFNVAFFIHTLVPLFFMAIGYPIGMYVVRHWLNIPADRIHASEWVFRITSLTAFVGMITVPYRAMYTAKQYIAELTAYSVGQTVFNVLVLYYMVEHPGDWLIGMSVCMGVQAMSVNIILMIRSLWLFPECRLKISYMIDQKRFIQLVEYAGWQFLSSLGLAARTQGMAILVNKFFSPIMNSSCTVANTVAGHSQTFAREVDLAFAPAIYAAYGAQDRDLQRALVYRCSKFATWLVLLLMVPLMLEMKEVLVFWLKTPPPYTNGICILLCLMLLTEKMTSGQLSAVNGTGNVRTLKMISCLSFFGTVIVAWIGFYLGFGMYMVGWASLAMSIVDSLGHLFIARKVADVPIKPWFVKVFAPLVIVAIISVTFASVPRMIMGASFMRILISSSSFALVFLPLSWCIVLSKEERIYVRNKFSPLVACLQKK